MDCLNIVVNDNVLGVETSAQLLHGTWITEYPDGSRQHTVWCESDLDAAQTLLKHHADTATKRALKLAREIISGNVR